MKLYKFGLPFAAIALFASCSNDKLDGPTDVNDSDIVEMSIRIAQKQMTRTATGSEGKEVGQVGEVEVTNAYIILAREGVITSASVAELADVEEGTTGYDQTKKATGKFKNKELGESFAASVTVQKPLEVYVIANYNRLVATPTAGQPVQQVLEVGVSDNSLWTPESFLMTGMATTTGIRGSGKQNDPYDLGTVLIARAVARFDIDLSKAATEFKFNYDGSKFTAAEGDAPLSLEFDGVALVNMSKNLNLFKEIAAGTTTSETAPTGWVFSDYIINGNNTENDSHVWVKDPMWGDKSELKYVFHYPAFSSCALKNPAPEDGSSPYEFVVAPMSSFTFTDIVEGTGTVKAFDHNFIIEDFKSKTPTGGITPNPSTAWSNYVPYRYCIPNTLHDKDKQLNGNSTGIIFRAKFKAGESLSTKAYVYAYKNYIFAAETADDVIKSIANPENDYPVDIAIALGKAVAKAVAKDVDQETFDEEFDPSDLSEITEEQALLVIDELKGEGFAKYEVDEDGYCHTYYYYWNRHNDNGNNMAMCNMEFGVVRNNIYKLSVSAIKKLGHPGKPGDDPDPIDPDDPDEEEAAWGVVQCEVLQWDVRVNEIVFD